MRDAETALGWPARAGKLVLTFALDRVARNPATSLPNPSASTAGAAGAALIRGGGIGAGSAAWPGW